MTSLAFDLSAPAGLSPHLRSVPPVIDRTCRPIWLAFHYAVPSDASADRTAIWRDLQDLRALNLQPGTWAIGRHEHDRDRLIELIQRAQRSGGTATVSNVGFDTREDVELQSKLSRACEHLWDEFFNESDWYAATAAGGTGVLAEQRAELDGLRKMYAAIRVRDLVVSDASGRAGAQLDDFTERLAAAGPQRSGAADAPSSAGANPRVELAASWRLRDGATSFIAATTPLTDLGWEQEFRAFEAHLYRPDPARVALRHGLFSWRGGPDSAATVLDGIANRIACFAASRA